MREPEMDESLPLWPEWLKPRSTLKRSTDYRLYRGGQWTYSSGYVFLIESKTLRYRKIIKTLEEHQAWTSAQWTNYGQDYDLSIDPITYIMESLL